MYSIIHSLVQWFPHWPPKGCVMCHVTDHKCIMRRLNGRGKKKNKYTNLKSRLFGGADNNSRLLKCDANNILFLFNILNQLSLQHKCLSHLLYIELNNSQDKKLQYLFIYRGSKINTKISVCNIITKHTFINTSGGLRMTQRQRQKKGNTYSMNIL